MKVHVLVGFSKESTLDNIRRQKVSTLKIFMTYDVCFCRPTIDDHSGKDLILPEINDHLFSVGYLNVQKRKLGPIYIFFHHKAMIKDSPTEER